MVTAGEGSGSCFYARTVHDARGLALSLMAPIRRPSADQAAPAGLRRSVRLFRLFLAEQSDPEMFYASLAEDAVQQVAEHAELGGRTVVDVGGGGGWFTAAFRARGAHCYLFEPDPAELSFRTATPVGGVVADGYWLPVRDGTADVVFSSNVLEHVPDPMGLIEEMIRATRPGGLVYLSYTNWYSPWGGHEMSPWHYLGPDTPSAGTSGAISASPSTNAASTCTGCTSGRCCERCGPGRTSRSWRRGPATTRGGAACCCGCLACVRSPPGTSC